MKLFPITVKGVPVHFNLANLDSIEPIGKTESRITTNASQWRVKESPTRLLKRIADFYKPAPEKPKRCVLCKKPETEFGSNICRECRKKRREEMERGALNDTCKVKPNRQ